MFSEKGVLLLPCNSVKNKVKLSFTGLIKPYFRLTHALLCLTHNRVFFMPLPYGLPMISYDAQHL